MHSLSHSVGQRKPQGVEQSSVTLWLCLPQDPHAIVLLLLWMTEHKHSVLREGQFAHYPGHTGTSTPPSVFVRITCCKEDTAPNVQAIVLSSRNNPATPRVQLSRVSTCSLHDVNVVYQCWQQLQPVCVCYIRKAGKINLASYIKTNTSQIHSPHELMA